MARATFLAAAIVAGGVGAGPAAAHFQEVIPATAALPAAAGPADVSLALRFSHPGAGGPVMAMGPPARLGVLAQGRIRDLLPVAQTVGGKSAYTVVDRPRRPGDHVYFIEPAPYWEPDEGKMIVHYAKVVVDAYEGGDGWDSLIGLPVEIEPLVRPVGLWTGSLFRGIVRRNGAPVPFAPIEVEWRNDGTLADFPTQFIKAGPDGAFSYVMNRPGWWGFAALVEDETTMAAPDGRAVPVELGGLMWVPVGDFPDHGRERR